jgi:hypothetical protein
LFQARACTPSAGSGGGSPGWDCRRGESAKHAPDDTVTPADHHPRNRAGRLIISQKIANRRTVRSTAGSASADPNARLSIVVTIDQRPSFGFERVELLTGWKTSKW